MNYVTLSFLAVLSLGLIINFIIINRKPKRTNYQDFYEGLSERRFNRLEAQREQNRTDESLPTPVFWEIITPLAGRANGNYFNFISLVKDKLIRKEPYDILIFDNTFLKICEAYQNELNYTIAKRLFPEDDWFYLLYISFLMSKGEQKFNWLTTYPADLFKNGFEIKSDLSISGACGYCFFKQTEQLMPLQHHFLLEEPVLWSDDILRQREPEIYRNLQHVKSFEA